MPRWLLIFLFVLVFLAVLVAGLPASFVARQVGLKAGGVDYMRMSGTVWSGEISRLSVAGQPVGAAEFRIRPASLLTGRLAYDFEIEGAALRARGMAQTGLDRGVILNNLVADVNLQEINRLDPRLRQSPATLALSIGQISIGPDGGCRSAQGGMRTDLLQSVGRRWDWTGPEMRGTLGCDGEALTVVMSGAGDDDEIRANARFDATRAVYAAGARVQTSDRGLAQALRALDFVASDGAFVYLRTNDPREAGEGELQN